MPSHLPPPSTHTCSVITGNPFWCKSAVSDTVSRVSSRYFSYRRVVDVSCLTSHITGLWICHVLLIILKGCGFVMSYFPYYRVVDLSCLTSHIEGLWICHVLLLISQGCGSVMSYFSYHRVVDLSCLTSHITGLRICHVLLLCGGYLMPHFPYITGQWISYILLPTLQGGESVMSYFLY